ncbi:MULTISPECIES: cell division protein CrgA [Trueperella]|uniref:Cell division protein CrgA n=1 Tax=Trueperella bernardiae TaxID=59561 RepID=A0A0W1KKK7_9ACTO|nr:MULTISPECIES: cell division protein CrgA [Trueperella]KTF04516.1 Cell division protein CrgA [Trueperella bernardiae]MCM3906950.1 cell division protein CrgA [Trueperella bernardiae]MDK8602261.1 cell division protein CrgA [Trueperella bernardiae]MDV6238525.1 cell division protein CrgA [Trueperella bernardiae]OCW60277.1 peptidase M22 [Trueperella bernardiae]
MPESKKRKKVVERRIAQQHAQENRKAAAPEQSPRWWVPVMVGLAVLGLIIIVIAYITGGRFPIPGLSNGNINIFVGIGFMLVGFLMTMGWK